MFNEQTTNHASHTNTSNTSSEDKLVLGPNAKLVFGNSISYQGINLPSGTYENSTEHVLEITDDAITYIPPADISGDNQQNFDH